MEIVYTFFIQKLFKIYTTDVYKVYTECIQIHITFRQTFVYILYTKSKELCQQNSYRMYIQIIVCRMYPLFQHILTYLLCIFLVNYCKKLGLRLETCWLITDTCHRYLSNQWINGLYVALNCQ